MHCIRFKTVKYVNEEIHEQEIHEKQIMAEIITVSRCNITLVYFLVIFQPEAAATG